MHVVLRYPDGCIKVSEDQRFQSWNWRGVGWGFVQWNHRQSTQDVVGFVGLRTLSFGL